MRLGPEGIASRLVKGVGPLFVLSGDEPLLVDEALESIRERAQRDGCGERESHIAERGFDWEAFAAGLRNMSLFASRRLIELRLPTGKPGEAGARFLAALAERPDTGNVVVILLPELDSAGSRSKWATALARAAVWVDLRPPRREQLPSWLRDRLRKLRLTADDEALDLLASRVEGNLLAAKQEIDKLALLAGGTAISAESVRDAVADGARFDVFQLGDAALVRDVGRTMRVLHGLRREGEPEALVLWCLVRDVLSLADIVMRVEDGCDLERALADARIWRNRQEAFRRAVRGRTRRDAARLLRSAARADQIVKGAWPGDPWGALVEVALELSGARPLHAETA
jgi:DNA polymerase-3 subunit delta